ncbi:arginine--tRNA ligase [Candidatus Campbellbacteria bacterium]|nr:MAG: arginine--tRNA ligase [Candidatus Campbellbacteria bacterium]
MILKIKKEIQENILQALEELGIVYAGKISVENPDVLKMGDFSSNIAMVLSKQEKTCPRELAQQIITKIQPNQNIAKVEVAGPGFINFFLSKKYFSDFVNDEHLNLNILKNKKFLIEHSSPNLFKPFHIGHLVNNAVGESLFRVFQFAKADIKQISFPSDKSLGIAKTVWGLKHKMQQEKNELVFDIKSFGDAYVLGTQEFEKSEDVKNEVIQINKDIYNEEGENFEIYKKGVEISKQYFLDITKRLGSRFDGFIYESESEEVGKEIIQNNIGKVFKKSEGAIIFEGSKYGVYDNVFINSDGFATYSGKDLGLLQKKFSLYDFDKSITLTDIEQKGHFQVVKKAAGLIEKSWEEDSEYISHGRLGFAGNVKISSRYGNVPLAADLIDKVKESIKEKIKDRDFEKKEQEEIMEKLAIGTLKYTILKVSCGKNMVFDFQKALSLQGNTESYLNYSLVRALSVLEKTNQENTKEDAQKTSDVSEFEQNLCRFDDIILKVIESYSPHHLANYLHQIATDFNSFYAETKILDQENQNYLYNLKLTKKFSKIMQKGLDLLGIQFVEKM